MKKININGTEYNIACNAFTRFQYKKVFNLGIFEDISKLTEFANKQEEKRDELKKSGKSDEEIEKEVNAYVLSKFDEFLDVVERIAYILILTANPDFESFEKWLSSIDKISLQDTWIGEVTEFAVSSFCG